MTLASRILLPLFIHPLFIFVLTMLCGICIQFTCLPHIAIASIPLALAIAFFMFPGRFFEWRIIIFCALSGFSLGAIRLHQQTTQHACAVEDLCNKPIDCMGIITDLQISQSKQQKHRITLSLSHYRDALSAQPNWTSIEASVFIYTRKAPTDCAVGDTTILENINFKRTNSNPSFNNYLLKEGIAATAFLQNATLKRVGRPSFEIQAWIHRQKTNLVNRLRNRFSQGTFALFTSLFLGNRTEEKKEQELIAQQSKNWGTSHHLARSGLHLVIFIYLLHSLLRFLPISLLAKEVLLLLLCIIYHLFSWSSISFMRAFLTFLFYKMCTLLRFPSHVLHVLTLACGLILFTNPMQLFFLDFQLSFGLTFTLAWFNAAYQAMRHK
jgi:predicted membrane metal-binding protein